MPHENLNLDKSEGPERSLLRTRADRAILLGVVGLSFLTLGDATTSLGYNPINYFVALNEYSAK